MGGEKVGESVSTIESLNQIVKRADRSRRRILNETPVPMRRMKSRVRDMSVQAPQVSEVSCGLEEKRAKKIQQSATLHW